MRKLLLSSVLSLGLAGGPILVGPVWAQQRLQPGGQVQGDLTKGDSQLDSGEFVDVYEVQGRAGQPLSVSLRSDDFDAYLMITGPGDFQEENDDGGDDGTNSTLDVRLPVDGIYRVAATSFEPGESGRYSIGLNSAAYTQNTGGSALQNSGGGSLMLDRTAAGALTQGDRTLSTGEFADAWSFQVRRGQTYSVSLDANDFDAYLILRGPGGLEEDNDDDPSSRGGRNSRVTFTAPADGTVNVSATSFSSGETGRYQIALQQGGPSSVGPGRRPQQAYEPSGRPVEGAIQLGQTVSGRLGQGDRQLNSGEYIHTYTLRGRRGQQLDLRLSSGDFDSYLAIQGPGGLSDFNDDDADSDGSRDSRLFVTLPADGDYEITATTYEAGEQGGYRLAVLPADGNRPQRPQQASYVDNDAGRRDVAGGSIRIGDTVGGALQSGDEQLDTGEYVDTFSFQGQRGQRVAVDLSSAAFDAYTILTTPSGEQIDNDDGEDGTNSHLDTVLTEDGEYQVMLTSYAAGETGSYRFSVMPSMGSARQAAVSGGARVFAIMVGISDYGDDANNLPYTDEDAEKLAETLQREGVLNPSSVVLTNAEATMGGVRRAFQQVAREAGPDDMFLFFFSGHGDQTETAPSALEPDGRYESIVLRDGELSDSEMADLFGSLRTRLSLLVLDSCFSGGFARNVVDRPGVMGLFSSEEDLTSAVADKFEAGGYLAHFLRAGMAGEADGDGDQAVTAGELATYLRRQFTAEVRDVESETMEGQRNYQNLVIDRGGVQVDDIVVRLASNGSSFGGL